MSMRIPFYGLVLLFLGAIGTAACDRAELTVTEPALAPAASSLQASFAAEPQALRPEFLPTSSCVTGLRFGTRISIIIGGSGDVILRGLRFAFNDQSGRRALPDVFPIPSLSSPVSSTGIPASSPIPLPESAALPGASPIPIPGSSPITGLFASAGTSRTLPFYLRFGCGVVAQGILVITGDAGDMNGNFRSSELRVRVN